MINNLSEENDKELYYHFLNGNQESFNILVKRYQKQLFNFIMKYINEVETAEDLVQEVFIYIFVTKKEYDFKYNFKTYLYTIAKSRIINYYKKNKITQTLENNEIIDNVEIDEELIKQENKESLLKSIDSLKKEYREVIYLRDLEGYSYGEISKKINKSLAQTKMLIYRARKSLKKKIIKKNKKNNILANILIILICLTGISFAGIKIYDFIQQETKTDFENNPEYDDYSEDMIYSDGLYYKVILNYEDYEENKKKWTGLVQMIEEDFDDYFIVVIAGENYDTTGLYISDITADDENLYIDLTKKEIWDGSTVISAKIQKGLYRESVIISNNSNIPNASDDFIDMEEIPIRYTKEQAIQDGCFVIEYGKIISNDKERFNEFIDNVNNDIEDFIRIYEYDIIENTTIIDLEYKNGKINMSQCNKTTEGNYAVYNSGNSILKTDNGIYWLKDEIGNKKSICSIEE